MKKTIPRYAMEIEYWDSETRTYPCVTKRFRTKKDLENEIRIQLDNGEWEILIK